MTCHRRVIRQLPVVFLSELSPNLHLLGQPLLRLTSHWLLLNACLPLSPQGCVTPALALDVMAQADHQMCMRYQGAAGGLEASALSLYPFTNEILTNMRVRACPPSKGWYV